jgi:hypothetical protein
VQSAAADATKEAIFQSDDLSVLIPSDMNDASLSNALKLGQANIMEFRLNTLEEATQSLDVAKLDEILLEYANDEGFVVVDCQGNLGVNPSGAVVAHNRFVLLMNKIVDTPPNPMEKDGQWQDTRIWELGECHKNKPNWTLPFNVDVVGNSPVADVQTGQTLYGIHRGTFFEIEHPPIINSTTKKYPRFC